MGIQARDIARFAKKNNLSVSQMAFSGKLAYVDDFCIKGVLAHMTGLPAVNYDWDENEYELLGLTKLQFDSLEYGFEGFPQEGKDKVYYKMGRNFGKLMGIKYHGEDKSD